MQESEAEKQERQQRELEAMRQAIAAYTGPVTKCPPFKTTESPGPEADRGGHDASQGVHPLSGRESSFSAECVLTPRHLSHAV